MIPLDPGFGGSQPPKPGSQWIMGEFGRYGAVFALTPTSTAAHPALPFGPVASIR
jgi:hypothetical protein